MPKNDNEDELDAKLREAVAAGPRDPRAQVAARQIELLKLTLARACARLGFEGLKCGRCELHEGVVTESRPGFVLRHGIPGHAETRHLYPVSERVVCGATLLAMDDDEEHDLWICPRCHLSMDSSSIELGDWDVTEVQRG